MKKIHINSPIKSIDIANQPELVWNFDKDIFGHSLSSNVFDQVKYNSQLFIGDFEVQFGAQTIRGYTCPLPAHSSLMSRFAAH